MISISYLHLVLAMDIGWTGATHSVMVLRVWPIIVIEKCRKNKHTKNIRNTWQEEDSNSQSVLFTCQFYNNNSNIAVLLQSRCLGYAEPIISQVNYLKMNFVSEVQRCVSEQQSESQQSMAGSTGAFSSSSVKCMAGYTNEVSLWNVIFSLWLSFTCSYAHNKGIPERKHYYWVDSGKSWMIWRWSFILFCVVQSYCAIVSLCKSKYN